MVKEKEDLLDDARNQDDEVISTPAVVAIIKDIRRRVRDEREARLEEALATLGEFPTLDEGHLESVEELVEPTKSAEIVPLNALGATTVTLRADGTEKRHSGCRVPKAESKSSDYEFPIMATTSELRSQTVEQLYTRLHELIATPKYEEVREEYCAINLELSRRHPHKPDGIQAPRFRPRRRPSYRRPGSSYPVSESLLSNDLQVLDLYWLYSHGRTDADDSKAAKVFNSDQFNFEAASETVKTRGSANDKVYRIGLDTDEQWSLAIIQSLDVRERWKEIVRRMKSNARNLQQKSRRTSAIRGNEREWAEIFAAVSIEKFIFPSAKVAAVSANYWFQLMTGKVISRQNMNNKLRAVKKHIGEP